MPRIPIESSRAVVVFAVVRVLLAAVALLAALLLGVPDDGRALVVLGAVALPWTLVVLLLARRDPDAALSPLVALGDISVLLVVELVVPELYGAVRFAALFMIAAHAHFQGERRGVAIAGAGSAALVLATALRGAAPLEGGVLVIDEAVFVVAAVATGLVVGRLRTSESASRLQARGLTRRTLRAEDGARQRVAESIHDGPLQELIGLDMILSTAAQAARTGEPDRAVALIGDARELTTRNVEALRDEIADLGPHALEELSFEAAIERCLPLWRRRYGLEAVAAIAPIDLEPQVAGGLFRIAQEAVVNAGRHARANGVTVALRSTQGELELRVIDDGHGFGGVDPFGGAEPGHLGLASMRERASLIGGNLSIETSAEGTSVVVRLPAT